MSQIFNSTKTGAKQITLARGIAELIPDGARFVAELTEEGVLFRFVGFVEPPKPEQSVPAWAKNGKKR